jgi:steroid delta-isomerase-like uncharacterized protein
MAQELTTRKHEPMTRARTDTVMREYLAALLSAGPFAGYFADDIVVTFTDLGQEIVGREEAARMITGFHQVAFDSALDIRSITAGPGIAIAEIVFSGTHTGDFLGIPSTGREVRVPYVAVWELAADQITALRLYGPATGLIQQLTAGESPQGPATAS